MILSGNEVWVETASSTVSRATAARLGAFVFPAGSIIFPKVGGALLTNKRRLLRRPSCIDNNVMGCVVAGADLDYAFITLQQLDLGRLAKPGPVPAIGEGDVREIRVALPPLPEQAAIVRFLHYVDGRIRRYLLAKQRLIELLEEQQNAVVHRAVTQGLDPRVPMTRVGLGWVDEVPAHWQQRQLSTLCELIVDGTHFSPKTASTGDFFYISARNIKQRGIETSGASFVAARDHHKIYRRCPVRYGDVLYIKDGATAGLATVNDLNEPFSMLSSVALIRPRRTTIRPAYLALLLNDKRQKAHLLSSVAGGAMTRFTLAKIGRFSILLPPLPEQDAILTTLSPKLASYRRAALSVGRELSLLRDYRSALIAAAVSGKLDLRDAAARLSGAEDGLDPLDDARLLTDSDDQWADELDAMPDGVTA